MSSTHSTELPAGQPGATAEERGDGQGYEPPAIRRLGSLADLTLGGDTGGPSDGFGTAGANGSI